MTEMSTPVGATQPGKPPAASQASDAILVAVDPRMEAMSIVFRLIEANEYNQPSSESAYSRAAAAHFAKHTGHEALVMAEKLREERSIGFDAVASFAAHLRDVESCEFLVPLEPWPETLDARWDAASARAFAGALQRFVRDTEFSAFWDLQRPFREVAEVRMREMLAKKPIKKWIEKYFGDVIPEDSCVLIGLLNGPANYGSSVRYPDGRVVVFPTIGAWTWDADGLPVFPDSARDTVLHEFCHPFVNPLVDRHLETLLPAGEELQKWRGQALAAQAYGEPRTALYESLVRASVTHLIRKYEGSEAGRKHQKKETSRGFLWTATLTDALERFDADRATYPTFKSFMPEIEKALARPTESMDTIRERVPMALKVLPEDGSILTDQEVKIRIEFDRTMDQSSRGLSFQSEGKYEVVTPGQFDADGKAYTVTLRFKPGAVKAWINQNGMGLFDEDGYAVEAKTFGFTVQER